MPLSDAIDDFHLAYDRHGVPGNPPVLLLHGWPGDRTDMTAVAERLTDDHDVVVPDLRGFGASDKHDRDPVEQYGAAAQARSVVGLLTELGLTGVVIGGYDVGSRVAQQVARERPDLVRALVVTPPAPGVGRRILDEAPLREFWYQSFHQLELARELVDGEIGATRSYLRHFWSHWSGPDFTPDDDRLDHLTAAYSPPGAFVASIGWYRAGGGAVARSLAETAPEPADRISVPTTFLWPEHDPLFPREWSDRVGEFFTDVRVTEVDDAGHFVPVEAPQVFSAAVAAAAR
ncbi:MULTISPECIES: alpha/beta fold hydrolase [Pseudonocardia]|uniref:Soluble epoxide hydrolase n=2 Tax=Pseudonocardia TaxID=1847 RepID=A0A1Y2N2X9_PSEAH|nr:MULTISPECIES: alpha/beta hydrolase [Pseudonocardia]OSY41824.1 Soluble epoxide hydrolase [Pseudonocardia autotrophica]TDN71124.1 pimeloyl-ACP methyl ester carboxylesterase [Pseudonocardia autotrophica]BBG01794.1 hydrolase [Pseudonocardia autotrophica]GEC26257.1 hydrolase [Pseudonocardia saturnea]